MEHPQALHDEKKSGPVIRFARNRLCALVNPVWQLTAQPFLRACSTKT
jgi:hypothetical protein